MSQKPTSKTRSIFLSIHAGYVIAAYITISSETVHIHRMIKKIFSTSDIMPLRDRMGKTLTSVLQELLVGIALTPERIFCCLHSPWSILEQTNEQTQKNTPFQITHDRIQELIDRAKQRSVLSAKIKTGMRDPVMLDEYRFSISAGGIPVPKKYHNRKTQSLSLDFSVSIADSTLTDLVREIIGKEIAMPISFIAPYNSVARAYIANNDIHDALIIRPGEMITNLFLIQGARMRDYASVPYGMQKLASEMSDRTGIVLKENDSHKIVEKILLDGKYSTKTESEGVINQSLSEWSFLLQKAFLNMNHQHILPADFWLDTSPAIAKILIEKLDTVELRHFTSNFTKPTIDRLSDVPTYRRFQKSRDTDKISVSFADQAVMSEMTQRYEKN